MKYLKFILCMAVCTSLIACSADDKKDSSFDNTDNSAVSNKKENYNTEYSGTANSKNNTEKQIDYNEEWYNKLLSSQTDETIASMVVEDFDNDGVKDAIATTLLAQDYDEFSASDIYMLVSGNIWYLHKEDCTRITDEMINLYPDLKVSLLGDTKCVLINEENKPYSEDVSVWSVIYTVDDGEIKDIVQCENGYIDEQGYLHASAVEWDEDCERDYDATVYSYENGELVPVK